MNYVAKARSNYFQVVDEAAFEAWAKTLDISTQWGYDTAHRVAVFSETDTGDWPTERQEESEEWMPIDFPSELQQHLVPGEVAILMEVGSEGRRYLVGCGIVIPAVGEIQLIHLQDLVMAAAQRWNAEVTKPEY